MVTRNLAGELVELLASYKPEADVMPETAEFANKVKLMIESGELSLIDFCKLFQRPYWTRIWILQEVVLRRKLCFLCGHKQMDYKSFEHAFSIAMNFITSSAEARRPHYGNFSKFMGPPIYMLGCRLPRLERDAHGFSTSAEHLEHSRGQCQASDPRDNIYALLCISTDRLGLGISIDYGGVVEDFYFRVAQALEAIRSQGPRAG
ncbi:hypothetical protein B0H63DRAFT_86349 [Podospora didyma]|uniref:Heterokaryon incompatibility domain-containing protein n=1 Tax=Podospora didyma TaxID=330526 RepID=A0AAE0N1V6_9PEZI|nr:hypothetical protein B0H63DRAFT_86349 [Podospora didyma]